MRRHVALRGKKDLVDALEAAARPAWGEGGGRPILCAVDVTPPLPKAETRSRTVRTALDERAKGVPARNIAALGGKPSKAVSNAAALASHLRKVLAKETDVVST